MSQPSNWRERVYSKAQDDPQFFKSLLASRDNPSPVLEAAGLVLSADDLAELQAVLVADRLEIDVDWNRLENMVDEAQLQGLVKWPDLIGWIAPGGWRP